MGAAGAMGSGFMERNVAVDKAALMLLSQWIVAKPTNKFIENAQVRATPGFS